MAKTTRKRAVRPARKRAPQRRGAIARLWRLSLLVAGLVTGLMLPWLLWLDQLVTTEFEGRKWDLPSRVFARPLSIYRGLQISPGALRAELAAAGYRRLDEPAPSGTYSEHGGVFEIHKRPFRFDDGYREARRFSVRLTDGAVSDLQDLATAASLDLVRLDPAEIASIYPLHEEDRSLARLDEAPELLLTGLQAVEDRQFKHHPGVDLRGIARALIANLRAGETVQGGSTLTQQLVKNYYLSNAQSLSRKINEALMALLLEFHYDKSEILEAYINEVHLGQQGNHGIHGFSRASEFYFGQPLQQLEPHQVALLVGLVRGASYYNPRRHPERALERRNRVLAAFAETGLMSAADAAGWKSRPLDVTRGPGTARNRYPAFVDLVRRQLRRDYREEDLRNEGLRIFTTMAPSEQDLAESAVGAGLGDLHERGLSADLQAALVLADIASGEVRALVGDRQADRPGFNRALDARRQIGSVVKPLIYLLALEHAADYSLLTRIRDEPLTLRQADGSLWSPSNYDGRSHGEVSLLEALTGSLNQATVQLGMKIGVNQLVGKFRHLGVEARIDPVPATLLGAVELTPLEVAQIYQSLAAGGFSVPLRAVTAVMTADGQVLNRYPLRLMPLPRRDAVAVLNYALTQVVETGTARELPALLGNPVLVAGKTGTTNERRDSWFVGYTRDRLAVTWVGHDDNRPAGVTGSNAAMRLWAGLFRHLPIRAVNLDMPEGAYWAWVEPELGALSDPDCAGAVQLPFVAGTEPQSESPCLARMEKRDKKSFWRKWFDRD
jgi:penicillin-binding protein 1B